MSPIEFWVARSKVKVTVIFKPRGDILVSQTFLVIYYNWHSTYWHTGNFSLSFYGRQVFIIHAYCRKHLNAAWNVTWHRSCSSSLSAKLVKILVWIISCSAALHLTTTGYLSFLLFSKSRMQPPLHFRSIIFRSESF